MSDLHFFFNTFKSHLNSFVHFNLQKQQQTYSLKLDFYDLMSSYFHSLIAITALVLLVVVAVRRLVIASAFSHPANVSGPIS